MLNQIFPPKMSEDDGIKMIQAVSTEDSQREDLEFLEFSLQQKLKDRQARLNGICPVREDLHN